MSFAVQTLADAGRNYTVRITAHLAQELELTPFLHLPETRRRISFGAAYWLIQEKLGLALYWHEDRTTGLLLVMESRNAVKCAPQLQPPLDWDGRLWLESFGFARVPEPPCRFVVTLDFDR
jgi:hypothetical protein